MLYCFKLYKLSHLLSSINVEACFETNTYQLSSYFIVSLFFPTFLLVIFSQEIDLLNEGLATDRRLLR